MPIAVDLETVDDSEVSIDIVDRSGSLVEAVSGSPADGASVPAYTLKVENVDARTLLLTWVDYPIDNQLALFIDEVDGHIRMALVQPEPRGETDAVAFDRELVLTFDRAIDASTVEAILQDGLDTSS